MHALSLSPWVARAYEAVPALLQTLALAGLMWLLTAQSFPNGTPGGPAAASVADPGAGSITPKQAARLLWLYATTWLLGATGWMYVSLHRFGELAAWLAAAAVLALCAALSLYMALVGWAWARWRRQVWWRDALLFAVLWLLAEWARAIIFTGFPWGASGYGMLGTPLIKLAPWLGVYGMGAVWVALVAVGVLAWRTAQGVARWLVPVALLLSMGMLSVVPTHHFTHAHGKPLSVTLLQGNVPQDEKFASERQVPMLIWHARELLQAKGRLVVAPETAIPLLPSQLPPEYWAQIESAFNQPGRYALIGVPLGDFDVGYTNSVAGLSAQAAASSEGMYRYNKHHLVPFGEFIPFGFHWFVQLMNMPLGDFSRGPLAAPPFAVDDQRVAPNICYEDLYGEEIAARFVDEARAPTIMVNVSNLAWFGEQVAIHQHLQIARMRSLEFQLPTLRATNTGATVVIDHEGLITASLQTNARGVLQAQVQGRAGVTPFAWWAGRWGLWPLLVGALGLLALALSGPTRPARSGGVAA